MVSRGAYAVCEATRRTWRDCSQEPSRLTRSKRGSYSRMDGLYTSRVFGTRSSLSGLMIVFVRHLWMINASVTMSCEKLSQQDRLSKLHSFAPEPSGRTNRTAHRCVRSKWASPTFWLPLETDLLMLRLVLSLPCRKKPRRTTSGRRTCDSWRQTNANWAGSGCAPRPRTWAAKEVEKLRECHAHRQGGGRTAKGFFAAQSAQKIFCKCGYHVSQPNPKAKPLRCQPLEWRSRGKSRICQTCTGALPTSVCSPTLGEKWVERKRRWIR